MSPFFRCPICGDRDAADQQYNARARKLRVRHSGGRVCEKTGVDEWGRPMPEEKK